jgi:hypothetical protein
VRSSLEKARKLLVTAKETALARYALTDDISALKDELTFASSTVVLEAGPKTLLEDLESSHERLDQLEQARTYLRIVERGVHFRSVVKHIPLRQLIFESSSEIAINDFKTPLSSSSTFSNDLLQSYVALHEFVASVSEACGRPDEPFSSETLNIVSFLRGLRSRTWREAKNVLAMWVMTSFLSLWYMVRRIMIEFVGNSCRPQKT